tara:strand:+ start:54 stop:542 length:489 start_codon:yes stop_codon:yes gene_type:complete
MKKLFLTITLAFATMFASAQFMAITTLNKVEGIKATPPSMTEVYEGDVCPTTETDDSYNITDKIGIGYMVNEKMMVGITKDGDDGYELLGRYTIKDAMWATCIYNYQKDSEAEMTDKLELGVGYSLNIWKNLYIEPNYTMPMKEDEDGNREGSLNLSFSYKF